MRRYLLALLFSVATMTGARAGGCDGILSLTRNLSYESKSIVIAQDIHDNYCQGSSLKSGSTFSLGLDATIKSVPIGLNLGSGSTKERVEHLCAQYSNWFSSNSNSVSLAVSTSDKAIDAWRQCVLLERESVFFSVDPRSELVAFGVRRGRDIIDFVGMNYISDHILCTGPVGTDGKEEIIDTNTRFRLTESTDVPITCRRKLIEATDGTKYLPATEVSISARGALPLIIPLPRDERYEPSLASDIQKRLSEADTRIIELVQALAAANTRIDEISKRVDSGVQIGDSIYLKTPSGYLYDYNRRGKDELDVILGGKDDYSRWTVEK